MPRRRLGIIGMGWVGSSIAISTLHEGIAEELLLNDVREDVAFSLPAIVSFDGATEVIQPKMDDAEYEGLARSVRVLRDAVESIGKPSI